MLLAATSWLTLLSPVVLATSGLSQHGPLSNIRSLHSGHRRHLRSGGHGLNTEVTKRMDHSRRLDPTRNFTIVDRHEGKTFFE